MKQYDEDVAQTTSQDKTTKGATPVIPDDEGVNKMPIDGDEIRKGRTRITPGDDSTDRAPTDPVEETTPNIPDTSSESSDDAIPRRRPTKGQARKGLLSLIRDEP